MQYFVYDVFTDQAFGGNPLAVVLDADGLETAQMQIIAREFGFSETTFVLKPETDDTDARVRIFTPSFEMEFAGHPTVGTALAMFDAKRLGTKMVLGLNVGPIPVSIADGRARFVTRVPLTERPGPSAAGIAGCVGIAQEQVRTDRHAPVHAGVGTEFVLAEVDSRGTLAQAVPSAAAFRALAGPDVVRLGLLIYCRDGQKVDARMFAPLAGIIEDPATGSAAAALAAYLGKLDRQSQAFAISQGVDMGRPSAIEAEVSVEDGAPTAVAIAGRAVKVMEGRLTL